MTSPARSSPTPAPRSSGSGWPLAIAIFFIGLGLVLMVAWRILSKDEFFDRRPFEVVPPEVAAGDGQVDAIGGERERGARLSDWEKLAALPLRVEGYELTGHDREYGSFTRPSTVVHLRGDGEEGNRARTSSTTPSIRSPTATTARCSTSAASPPSVSSAPRLRRPTSFRSPRPGWRPRGSTAAGPYEERGARPRAAPGWDAPARSARARPQAAELRLLYQADRLRERGGVLDRATEQAPGPLPPTSPSSSTPKTTWTPELIEEIKGLAPVRVLDLKGHYKGTPVDVDTDPELYAAVAEAFPEAYLEDPDVNDETRPILEPARRPLHLGRAAALARRRHLAGVEAAGDQLQALTLRLDRGGALDLRPLRGGGHRDLRRRAGRGRMRPRPDPVPGLPLPPPTRPTTPLPPATTTRRSRRTCRRRRWIRCPPRPASAGGSRQLRGNAPLRVRFPRTVGCCGTGSHEPRAPLRVRFPRTVGCCGTGSHEPRAPLRVRFPRTVGCCGTGSHEPRAPLRVRLDLLGAAVPLRPAEFVDWATVGSPQSIPDPEVR